MSLRVTAFLVRNRNLRADLIFTGVVFIWTFVFLVRDGNLKVGFNFSLALEIQYLNSVFLTLEWDFTLDLLLQRVSESDGFSFFYGGLYFKLVLLIICVCEVGIPPLLSKDRIGRVDLDLLLTGVL